MEETSDDRHYRLFAFDGWRDYLPWILMFTVIGTALVQLHLQGRIGWCKWDPPYILWSSDAWGKHNSQHLFDPYTFTHILHGFLYFWFLTLIFGKRISLKWLMFFAVVIESAWEILENSNTVIERYRTATLALDYYGDSVLNSFGDILSCAAGFIIARKLGLRRSLALFFLIEIILIFWIHDSLLINIIQLIHSFDAIKTWQAGS